MNEITLTQKLIQFNTINPPGNEQECVFFIGELLKSFGMSIQYYEFAEKRTSLIASYLPQKNQLALCFNGHIDTVPLGEDSWEHDPFSGTIDSDKLHGRGSSDMKSGVAAVIIAVKEAITKKSAQNIIMIITAGEEIGCRGAHFLKKSNYLPQNIGALIIAEPTANDPFIGHKGVLWLRAKSKGVTAHGSMPEKGDNAILRLIKAFQKLDDFSFQNIEDPIFGKPTLNIGMIQGGQNINSVPDEAFFTIDIRTINKQNHNLIINELKSLFEPEASLEIIENVPGIYSEPNHPWIQNIFEYLSNFHKISVRPSVITYGTDASYLKEGLKNPPTIIIGPGEPQLAHKTNEFCFTSKITEAKDIFSKMIDQWSNFSSLNQE